MFIVPTVVFENHVIGKTDKKNTGWKTSATTMVTSFLSLRIPGKPFLCILLFYILCTFLLLFFSVSDISFEKIDASLNKKLLEITASFEIIFPLKKLFFSRR